ncbi:MAG: hypothetical protein EPO07_16600 [Verrucomicrobia bacterium]|nr:MAG: hypothetical protein EPO07_16600 [Verrucomicrobiota bacterium]
MKPKRAIDLAKEYRERVFKSLPTDSEPWPLTGVKQFPCERALYFSLKPDETPNQLFRIVFNQRKEMMRVHGEIVAAGTMWSLIVTPDGEGFCSFRIASYPLTGRGETEEQKIPMIERSVALYEDFAARNGRKTAMIQEKKYLVCSDGRRFLLSECACVPMMNDEIVKNFRIPSHKDTIP